MVYEESGRKSRSVSLLWKVLIPLILLSCEKGGERRSFIYKNPPDEIINNFSMIEMEGAKKVYSVRSGKAYIYETKGIYLVFNPEIKFYDEDGNILAEVRTDTGIIYQRTGKFFAKGGVVLETNDGTVLHTDSIVWDHARRRIITDAPVELHRDRGVVRAKGMESDAFMKHVIFKGRIEGEAKMED